MSARRKIMNKNYEANETNSTNNTNSKNEAVGGFAGVGFLLVIGYLIFQLAVIGIVAPGMIEQQNYTKGLINTMNRGFIDMDCDGIPDEDWDQNDANLQRHQKIVEIQKQFQ